MLVNKISSVAQNVGFKGYQHTKNDVGETVMRFNYPYNPEEEDCKIQIFRVKNTDNYNYKVYETPIKEIYLKPEGVDVNIQELTNFDKDEAFAYNVVLIDKNTGAVRKIADTGVKIKNINGTEFGFRVSDNFGDDPVSNYKYTLVTRRGTTPMVQGAGYLIVPDSYMPGAKYKGFSDADTGKIEYNEQYQKEAENSIKHFSRVFGGSMAGMELMVPKIKEQGYKVLFTNPIANGSKGWSLGYWNKNNMQISPNMGNAENFASFFRELYTNGMKYVYDGTFTSEGLEGIHFQYAQRWAEQNPQSYYWFRMDGLKNSNLGYGVVPKNAENLRYRVINAPYNYELQSDGTYKKVSNPNYKSDKETLFQIYDASQTGEDQLKALDKAIERYNNLKAGDPLCVNTHDDTIINYVFQINPKEYDKRIDVINNLNKNYGKNIKLDSEAGTLLAGQFSNFKINKKTEGGFVAWDANTDMVKMNYHISGYDEKALQTIVAPGQREYERQRIIRGTKEVQDMAVQAGRYWTGKVRDIQTIYTAKTIGSAKTIEALNKLIQEGKLPQETTLSTNALNNILNGNYMFAPKGVLSRDDVTVKSLMKLPLDSLELGENTTGVLSTSYFSNRATTDETIGKTRFELLKENNPHLVEPYTKVYNKVNQLFCSQIKNFADEIIKKVNESSPEKLIDSDGEYTEYGEYVIELVGQDIAKYALLKAIGGKNFKTKILDNGEITYDYELLRDNTSLKALGINADSPTTEARILEEKFEKGLKSLSKSDIDFVADSVKKRISGTDTISFRIAEAMVDKASLGLDWRLDAAKDIVDMDAVRNGENTFDDAWNEVINFWRKFVKEVKSENPNSYIVAEITDIADLMRDTYGIMSCPYNGETNIGQIYNGEPDALAKFFNETGITSEAAYSYFFTDLLTSFSRDFERGTNLSSTHNAYKNRLMLLLQTRNPDYLRNLYTFMGNHDKLRTAHGLALDMELFHANLLNPETNNFEQNRKFRQDVIRVMTGAKTDADIPIELKLNIDNNGYFLTTSTKAVAMNKLLLDVIYEDIGNILSEDDKKLLAGALVDLANGNYLGTGITEPLEKIRIPELSSLNTAFGHILSMAEAFGLRLSETERNALIEKVVNIANHMNLEDYLVHGDLDWRDLDAGIKEANNRAASEILGVRPNYTGYSLYTIQLARLLKAAYKETNPSSADMGAFDSALKHFVEKFDKKTLESNTNDFRRIEDSVSANIKNAYGARDIRLVIDLALTQAEYKSGRKFTNRQAILDKMYQAATEPAVTKLAMITEALKALIGIPTTYAGDEYGMTGYEEKAKNIYQQNRNVLPFSELDKDSEIGKYRRKVRDMVNGAIKDRSNPLASPLNNGTPYMLDVDGPQSSVAYMMQSANGDTTISLMDFSGINHSNRFDYFKEYGLDNEEKRQNFFKDNNIESINEHNKYVPIKPKTEVDMILLGAGIALPVGTIFANINSKDKTEYVVARIKDKLGIVRKDGGKIVMDGLTAKNGVMVLRKLKNVAFKGNSKSFFNRQYNIVSNPYMPAKAIEEGKNLSIVSK